MGKLIRAYQNLSQALESFHKSIIHFEQIEKMESTDSIVFMEYEELRIALRDSMIQRFEFSVDLFWKYLKKYLDEVIRATAVVNGPRPVIKASCKAGIVSERDAEILLRMIDNRNMTSHMYREEIVDRMCTHMLSYYKVMMKYTQSLAWSSDQEE